MDKLKGIFVGVLVWLVHQLSNELSAEKLEQHFRDVLSDEVMDTLFLAVEHAINSSIPTFQKRRLVEAELAKAKEQMSRAAQDKLSNAGEFILRSAIEYILSKQDA